MDIPATVYSKLNIYKNSKQYSTEDTRRIFGNLADLIPEDGYEGFYVNKLKELGLERFMELANKARRGKSPMRLFTWMLTHNQLVR